MQFSTVAIIALAVAASVLDLRTHRLPNLLTFGGAALALAASLWQGGPQAAALSAAGWLVAVLLFFPVFALRGLGAGDVKLLGAFGAWLGPMNALFLAFFTATAGGVLALVVVLWRGYLKQAFRNLWLMLMMWRTNGVRPVDGITLESSRGPRLAYGVPIAVGALTTLWLR